MTNRPKAWENPNKNAPRQATKPRRHAPASEAHKRSLALDYAAATPDQRPTMLRAIACAMHKDAYRGRMTVLYEAIDAAYETAPDKEALEDILATIAADLTARKDGAALLNAAPAIPARSEIDILRDPETPDGVRAALMAKRVRLGKTSPVVLGRENVVEREEKLEPIEAEKDEILGTPLKPAMPLDEFVPPATAPLPCENDWARDDDKRAAFWTMARDILGVQAGKNVRDTALALFGVPDEFRLKMSVPEAATYLRSKVTAPEPEPSPKVEIVKSEDKPVAPATPNLTEASVIIFAKSDIYYTLPDGSTLALSITLREGASMDEVIRLLAMYSEIASLPNISTSRPAAPGGYVPPAAPQPVATPATPAPSQPQTGGERISKVVSGVKVAYDEKGQKHLQLFGKYGENWGTGPDHTCRKPEEIASACTVAGVNWDNLEPGETVPVTPFTVSWTKGKETKPGSGRFYHDNATFTRN